LLREAQRSRFGCFSRRVLHVPGPFEERRLAIDPFVLSRDVDSGEEVTIEGLCAPTEAFVGAAVQEVSRAGLEDRSSIDSVEVA